MHTLHFSADATKVAAVLAERDIISVRQSWCGGTGEIIGTTAQGREVRVQLDRDTADGLHRAIGETIARFLRGNVKGSLVVPDKPIGESRFASETMSRLA